MIRLITLLIFLLISVLSTSAWCNPFLQPRGATHEVHVVGVEQGTYPKDEGPDPNLDPAGVVHIKVHKPDSPIVLVLTSVYRVVWKIDAPPESLSRIIVTSQLSTPIVEGASPRTPITRICQKTQPNDYFFAIYKSLRSTYQLGLRGRNGGPSSQYLRLVQQIKKLTNSEVTTFQGKQIGHSFDIPNGEVRPVPIGLEGFYELHSVGVHQGVVAPNTPRPPGLQLAGSVKVSVAAKTKRILLILTAYNPVNWTVDAPKGVVVGVIASGYHRQAVYGLDPGTPLTYLSYENDSLSDYFFSYHREATDPRATQEQRNRAEFEYDYFLRRAKELTNLDLTSSQNQFEAESFTIR